MQGLPGPSDAYSTFRDETFTLAAGVAFQTVLTLTIPQAGSYVILGKLELNDDEAATRGPTCRVLSGGNVAGTVGLGGTVGNDNFDCHLTVVTTLAAPGTAQLQCRKRFAADDLLVARRGLTAIRVGNLANTPAP